MVEATGAREPAGTVYLVGAGPGDPGLLTVRAAELIASADAIVYDASTAPAVLERRAATATIYSLADPADPAGPAAQGVADRLVDLARRYPRVVRLFSGDPFLFGNAGPEALALKEAGVAFEVVPGVPAAVAAPAYAGIPVAHPGIAASVAFIDAQDADPGDASGPGPAWPAAAADTRVVRLAGAPLGEVVERLIAGGIPRDAPAALIEWATHPRQRTVTGTLGDLSERGDGEARPPALLVVGEAVRLRERLAWFESRPLYGRRIVITRARAQAAEFARSLEGHGAEVIPFPTIRITDPGDPRPLRSAVREAQRFDWIVFTSANAVQRFWFELRAAARDTRSLAGVSLCAIGPATAAALEAEGAGADLVPPEFVAESVLEALNGAGDLRGARILLPRAEVARPLLPEALRERGAVVVEVPAYRTVPDGAQAALVRDRFVRDEVDVVTFTASSTVRNFAELLGTEIGGARVACIGPITARTAREAGFPVHIEAKEYTIPGLVVAIHEYFTRAPNLR